MNKFFINIKSNLLREVEKVLDKIKEFIRKCIESKSQKKKTAVLLRISIASILIASTIIAIAATASKTSDISSEVVNQNEIQVIKILHKNLKTYQKSCGSFSEEFINGRENEKSKAEDAEKKREQKKIRYRQIKENPNSKYLAPVQTPSAGFVLYDVPLDYGWQVYTYNLCVKYNVDYKVMLGLMYAESTFRFDLTSGVAWGICQIHQCHEGYAKSIGIDDYKKPEGNILLSVMFMSEYVQKWNGDYHKALIYYNYGPGGAEKHCFNKGIYETAYSKRVMNFANNVKPAN